MFIKKRNKIILLTAIFLVILSLVIWIVWSNKALELSNYTVSSKDIPDSFDGYKIAHISDLHNTEIGKDNKKLIETLKKAKPDIIAITGDLIDSRHTDIKIALQFIKQAVKIAPCYYVAGNHEARISEYDEFKKSLITAGVNVLENKSAEITCKDESILLIGVNDTSFNKNPSLYSSKLVMEDYLKEFSDTEGLFTVLLSHRPELFDVYVENNIDLALTGHVHGGQFRLPFVGGLLSPNQGLFPEYDAGKYEKDKTVMIISRGIGNSIIPLRFNNRPEVVLIELKTKS